MAFRKRSLQFLIFALLAVGVFRFFPSTVHASQEVRIGVLAYRGTETAFRMWTPTADFLTRSIPGHSFKIVPLGFDVIASSVSRGEVDFVVANSEIYVDLEAKYGISRIATLKNKTKKGGHKVFGGVIFCRADRNDIRTMNDLKGKKFAAVDAISFGGWGMAWRELKAKGINPSHDFELSFSGTHDVVVYAVRDRKVDAGTVRSDTLERMSDEGKIDISDYFIINRQNREDFPFLLSTRLYPEWPFAKVKHTRDDLAKKVAIALFSMQADDPAAKSSNTEGWTIPLDYQPVHELMKELRIGAYKDFGKVTLSSALRQYWYWFVSALFLLLLMAFTTVYVVRLNRGLRKARFALEQSGIELEMKVKERTAELVDEIKVRRRAEEELNDRMRQADLGMEVGVALTAGDSLHDILQRCADAIVNHLDAAFARIWLFNPKDGMLELRASAGMYTRIDGSHSRVQPGETKIGLIARDKKPLFTNNVIGDPHITDQEWAKREGIVAFAGHPLIVADNLVGVMGMFSCKPLQTIASEALAAVADEIALGVMRKQIDEELMEHRIHLEELVEERTLELTVAKEKAEVASQAKSTFLSSMSHELRTPLNAILGYAHILRRDDNLTQKQRQHLDIMRAGGEHLLTLINDILDVGKIEAQKMEIEEISFELSLLLRQVCDITRIKAEEKDLSLRYEVLTPLPEFVWGDERKLKQILLNLLSNAVRYTRRGSVTLKIAYGLDGPEILRCEVADTGAGIPPDKLETIFEPFTQLAREGQVREGTGLGLTITRRLVSLLRGSMDVESRVGKGSSFRLMLELPQVNENSAPVETATGFITGYEGEKKKILVIDDNNTNVGLLFSVLEPLGFEISTADGGREGLARAREQRPDLVLMDLVMPEMDGRETAIEMRKFPELAGTKIIGVSATVTEGARKEAFVAVCDDFLPKPVNIDRLLERIADLLGITWITTVQEISREDRILPGAAEGSVLPTEDLNALHELALLGDMRRILEWTVKVENEGDGLFARKVREMAEGFNEKEILELVESEMKTAENSGNRGGSDA